jgi:hypothetical protein
MNGGEGAARRHSDYMLATGQWTYSGAGQPSTTDRAWPRVEERAAPADTAIRSLSWRQRRRQTRAIYKYREEAIYGPGGHRAYCKRMYPAHRVFGRLRRWLSSI